MMPTRTSTRARTAPKRFEEEVFVAGANNKHTVGRVVDAGQGVCQVDGSEHRMSAAEAAELARVEEAELCWQEHDDKWGEKEVPCGAAGNQMEELGRGEWTEPKANEEKAENDRRFREDLCDRGMCGDNCVLCADDAEVEESEEEDSDVEEEEEEDSEVEESEAEEEEEWVPDGAEEEEESEVEEDWLDTTDKLYWGEIMPLPASVRWFSLKNGIWSRCCYAKKIGEDRWLVAPLDWLEECPEKMVDEQEWLDNSIGVLTNTELHVNEYIVGDFEEAFGRKAEPSRWMAMPDDE